MQHAYVRMRSGWRCLQIQMHAHAPRNPRFRRCPPPSSGPRRACFFFLAPKPGQNSPFWGGQELLPGMATLQRPVAGKEGFIGRMSHNLSHAQATSIVRAPCTKRSCALGPTANYFSMPSTTSRCSMIRPVIWREWRRRCATPCSSVLAGPISPSVVNATRVTTPVHCAPPSVIKRQVPGAVSVGSQGRMTG